MSVLIELPPETETTLRAEADRSGVDPGEYVARLIEERMTPLARQRLTPEEWLRKADAWAESHRHWPPLPDEAYERESFYEDRW